MVALTQLTPHAGPGQRYGSFAGKEADSGVPPGPHNPGTITQLRPYAGPGGRYGSFAGKEASVAASTPEVVGGDDVPYGFTTGSKSRARRKRRTDAERIAELQQVYARIVGEAEPAAAVVAAVQPYVEVASDARLPPVEAIDWRGLLRDLDAVAVLLQLHSRILDDDDAVAVLLLT